MAVPLKIDITTGDKITPREMDFSYSLMFEDRSLSVLAYNLETVLAEKLETIVSRSDQNTRPRDFYDVHTLYRLRKDEIDANLLSEAIKGTSVKRNTLDLMLKFGDSIDAIRESQAMKDYWNKYRQDFAFVGQIEFDSVVDSVEELLLRVIR